MNKTVAIMGALLCAAALAFPIPRAGAEEAAEAEPRVISRDAFVRLAAENDSEFEAILIRELSLQYASVLQLPPAEWLASVKEQFEWYEDDSRGEVRTTLGLGRLFPLSATELAASADVRPGFNSPREAAGLEIRLTQAIARNAFGKSTRLLDRIIGLETEVAAFQIVEAYEDYLAFVLNAWLDWERAHLDEAIAHSAYRENMKLLENMRERQAQQIAKPIDVNKVTLQIKLKEEAWVIAQESLRNARLQVQRIARLPEEAPIVPAEDNPTNAPPAFAGAWVRFESHGRTMRILETLDRKSELEVDREADDLLPSIGLALGLNHEGESYRFSEGRTRFLAGIEAEWPFPRSRDRAAYEVAAIERQETRLRTENRRYRLYTDLKNLHAEMERDRRLIRFAAERIELATQVLTDEAENYSFGRVSLNDFIQAVNRLDAARFDRVRLKARYAAMWVEWLRLTDQLVSGRDLGIVPDE